MSRSLYNSLYDSQALSNKPVNNGTKVQREGVKFGEGVIHGRQNFYVELVLSLDGLRQLESETNLL